MKKYIKLLFIVTLMVCNIFVYESCYIDSQAEEVENNLDLLIINKQIETELKLKIEELNKALDSKLEKIASLENEEDIEENDVEVVKLSFVHNDPKDNIIKDNELDELSTILRTEITYIEDEIQQLDKKLQEHIIEDVRLEKVIQEEKKEYLDKNNLEFIDGSWPIPSYTQISSPFGDRIHPITNEPSFHKGIDIPAPQYTDIVSVDDGIVIFSGAQNGYGNVVKIKHFDGKITVYAHNTSNIVNQGDVVKRGQAIAQVGSTGDSTGNHVHFETIVNGVNLNPINVINIEK